MRVARIHNRVYGRVSHGSHAEKRLLDCGNSTADNKNVHTRSSHCRSAVVPKFAVSLSIIWSEGPLRLHDNNGAKTLVYCCAIVRIWRRAHLGVLSVRLGIGRRYTCARVCVRNVRTKGPADYACSFIRIHV